MNADNSVATAPAFNPRSLDANLKLYHDVINWSLTNWDRLARCLTLICVAVPAVLVLCYLLRRSLSQHYSDSVGLLVSRTVKYTLFFVLALMILREFNFNLTALLGAAGVLGIAVGFAAQTSLSNIISGAFLVWEKPFKVGDLVHIEDHVGWVHAVDLLSVFLRTFDNKLIRIPNESLIKASFVNVTKFPVRRMDIILNVPFERDLEQISAILEDVAENNAHCLDEPRPLVMIEKFGQHAVEIRFGCWFVKEEFVLTRNTIFQDIKKAFDKHGVRMPVPARVLHPPPGHDAFPIAPPTAPTNATTAKSTSGESWSGSSNEASGKPK